MKHVTGPLNADRRRGYSPEVLALSGVIIDVLLLVGGIIEPLPGGNIAVLPLCGIEGLLFIAPPFIGGLAEGADIAAGGVVTGAGVLFGLLSFLPHALSARTAARDTAQTRGR